jgi:RNA polymerase sigma-70 factor, ECF subfamily
MVQSADDASLIEQVAAGEITAVRGVLARYQARVFGFVLRLVGDRAVAEEITNEVFFEVWKSAGNYRGSGSVATWIFAIAHHRAVSSLRKAREERWNDEQAAALADPSDDPEVGAQKTDERVILRRCIDMLSPEHKGIIDLVYYHEMSISEVSEVLGIPEGTVKTRMFHARKRLSELLKRAGVDRGGP